MKSDNIYLDNYTYSEALAKYSEEISKVVCLKKIEISAKDSLGYVLAKPVFAKSSSPNFTASAMDGIAVDYKKTSLASETNYITLEKDKDYMVVDTGDYIKPCYNAVIMVEDLFDVKDGTVKIASPIGFFENIRSAGEDIVTTQMILPRFHKIRPVDIGAILAGGVSMLTVFKPLSVGIMATGSEIVDVTKGTLETGDIIDSNSYMLRGLVQEMGLKASTYGVTIDDYCLLKEKVAQLTLENDIVLINAGSSAGREDFTKNILEELGEVFVHGIAIKPGKPVILAIVNHKIVIGLPGYPVACYMIFEKVIKPIINNILKQQTQENILNCTLIKRVNSSLKHLEFVRVKIGFVNNKWIATPLARGAGASMSLVECDGVLEVPKEYEGYEKGEVVPVKLTRHIDEIKNQIIVVGSHDMILDFVKDTLLKDERGTTLSSTHLGSFGGVMALRNKECFVAPIHILDDKTGVYNVDIVKKFFGNEKMVLIKGVKRQQGLIVKKGNPLNINRIEDVIKHTYVNRQVGSGTYILLEHLLNQADINNKDIAGFDFNVPTHFDVAINVKESVADCGLGVYSVAKALDLDFVHIANEDYDFLMYENDFNSDMGQLFIETLKSEKVKKLLDEAKGYEHEGIGEIIHI
ncbi:MAG: molybdopterin biosynthesis protein [Lachnospirales bacterium]